MGEMCFRCSVLQLLDRLMLVTATWCEFKSYDFSSYLFCTRCVTRRLAEVRQMCVHWHCSFFHVWEQIHTGQSHKKCWTVPLINMHILVSVLPHSGNLLICSDAAVHLHADENGHSGSEGSHRHEGLHTRPSHPGDDQHPQPVWEDHRQHGSQPDAGKQLALFWVLCCKHVFLPWLQFCSHRAQFMNLHFFVCFQRVTYETKKPTYDLRTVAEVEGGVVKAGKEVEWKEKIIVPPLAQSSLAGCELIKIEYYVKVRYNTHTLFAL